MGEPAEGGVAAAAAPLVSAAAAAVVSLNESSILKGSVNNFLVLSCFVKEIVICIEWKWFLNESLDNC